MTGVQTCALPIYYDLARFGEETGLLTTEQLDRLVARAHSMPDKAEEAVHRARDLREALHEIFSALMNKKIAPQPAVDALNANLHDAALHSLLVETNALESKTPHAARLEWRSDDLASSFHAILWPIARAGGDLLASSDIAMVRTCSSPTCQWFFLDKSKNHRRRWCDMKVCGNRAKVRKFYARKRGSSDVDA